MIINSFNQILIMKLNIKEYLMNIDVTVVETDELIYQFLNEMINELKRKHKHKHKRDDIYVLNWSYKLYLIGC